MKADRESTEMIVYLEKQAEHVFTRAWLVIGIGESIIYPFILPMESFIQYNTIHLSLGKFEA